MRLAGRDIPKHSRKHATGTFSKLAYRQLQGKRTSVSADPHDLATREIVEVEFGPSEGRVGLVLTARQTLLSTHLFYQSLAYFGSRAGEYLARLERGGPALSSRATGMARALESTVEEIAAHAHAHPSMAEAVMEAALAAMDRAIHI